jgi:hypothetical protein
VLTNTESQNPAANKMLRRDAIGIMRKPAAFTEYVGHSLVEKGANALIECAGVLVPARIAGRKIISRVPASELGSDAS